MDAIIINMKEPKNVVAAVLIDEKRKKVAEILQTARVQKGLTQEQLSEMVNCRVQTIGKIENARYSPNADILYNLCDALELKITIGNTEI